MPYKLMHNWVIGTIIRLLSFKLSYTEDETVISGETYIGRDVTTSTTEGPVLVQSGTLTINSPKKVYIKNSFKVESGAKLRINP